MKSSSYRHLFVLLAGLATSLLIGSCGGGGAAGSTQGGNLSILPTNATWYAGIPNTITVIGGRGPYQLSSSEPSTLPVPPQYNGGVLQLLPANPGVIDTGIPPGGLPVRTVTITARDTTGGAAVATIQVAQNFLTGYGLTLAPTTCTVAGGTGAAPAACAGGDTLVRMSAVFNGNLYGNQAFRFQVIRGNFALKDPVTGQVSDTVTTVSDTTGTVQVFVTVPANAPTQLAVIRTIHIPTGVYADQVFVIQGANTTTALTAIPATITFTGATTTQCGSGTADILVFDGLPPYTAVSTNPQVSVTPTTSNTQPGRFTVTAVASTQCFSAPIVITDAAGRRVTVTVSSEAGTAAPPTPAAFNVSPTAFTLSCGATGTAAIVGGSGNYFAVSSHPRVQAVASGALLQITRLTGDTATFPTTATVTVSDGTNLKDVTVTVPGFCL